MRTKISKKHASVLHIKGPHNIAKKRNMRAFHVHSDCENYLM